MAIGFDPAHTGASFTLSNSNRTATYTGATGTKAQTFSIIPLTAKTYFEVTVVNVANSATYTALGLTPLATDPSVFLKSAVNTAAFGFASTSAGINVNGVQVKSNSTAVPANETIGFAYDPTTRQVWMKRSSIGTWNYTATHSDPKQVYGTTLVEGGLAIPGTDVLFLCFASDTNGGQVIINNGEVPFVMAPPGGYINGGNTTWFVDPEGGNDANNGYTFATRKRTMNSIAGYSINYGDQVRVMASRPRQQVVNATWTDNSATLTLSSALTANIDTCDAAWSNTGGNPSAATSITTSSTCREGTRCVQFNIPQGTASGKIGFRPTGAPLDFSAYTAVSMQARFSLGGPFPAGNVLVLDLCSDTTGDVPLVTIPLNFGSVNDAPITLAGGFPWQILATDTKAPLPSGVNSVALRLASPVAFTGVGGATITIDNIIAAKSWDDPNHLSHISLISKDTAAEPEYYPVMRINGTTVGIGGILETLTSNVPRPYRGTTETVPTYFRTPTRPAWLITDATLNYGGMTGNRVVVSGGWNRTDMSTQTDYTVWTGVGVYGCGVVIGSNGGGIRLDSVEVSAFGFAHYLFSPLIPMGQGTGDHKIRVEFVSGCYSASLIYVLSVSSIGKGYDLRISRGYTHNGGGAPLAAASSLWSFGFTMAPLKLYIRRIHGSPDSAGMQLPSGARETMDVEINSIDNNNGQALTTPTFSTSYRYMRNCVFKNNTADFGANMIQSKLVLDRCTLQGVGAPPATAFNDDGWSGQLLMTAVGGVSWDNREYSRNYSWVADNTVRHSADGVSVKVSVKHATFFTANAPLRKSLVKVACKSGVPKKVNVWVQRDNVGLTIGLMTVGSYIAGVGNQSVAITAAVGVWQQLTLNFTPTENGLVEVWGFAYGGTTFNGWFSDVTVT